MLISGFDGAITIAASGAAVAIGWNWWMVKSRGDVEVAPVVDGDRVGLIVRKRW